MVRKARKNPKKNGKRQSNLSVAHMRTDTARLHQGPTNFGFPRMRTMSFRYASYFRTNVTTYNYHTFHANNCHDPDVTATGHQPMGWDEMKVYYERYIVKSARIKITTARAVSDNAENAIVGIYLAGDPTPSAIDWATMAEQPTSVTRLIPADWDNSASVVTLYGEFDAKSYFNVTDVMDNEERIGGNTAGATVATPVYFVVFYDPLDGSAQTNMDVLVEIEYDVILSVPKELNFS